MKNYSLGLYEKAIPNNLTIIQKLEITKLSGFDYLELSIDETDEKLKRLNWSHQEILELLIAQHKIGVPIKSICLSGHRKYPFGHPDPVIRSKSMAIISSAINLAAALGVRLIQLAGYDVFYEPSSDETVAFFEKSLFSATAMAASAGVTLAFETMETPFMDTIEKSLVWVNKMNSPYLQLYPDCGNLTNALLIYNSDLQEDMLKGEGHIAALHLKETAPEVFRELPYGSGHVDFEQIIRCSKKLGVGMFVGEFWYVGQENWQQTITENHRFLRSLLDKHMK